MNPWLDDATIDDMCAGLSNNAAKIRRLRAMMLTVARKPNGRPLVLRSNVERVFGGVPQATLIGGMPARPAPTTNRDKLLLLIGGKGG